MKKLLILLSLLICVPALKAQDAQPVYSYALVKESPEWYHLQIKNWREIVEKDPSQHIAWYYIYYATRNAQRTDPKDTRPDSVKLKEMSDLVDEIGRKAPDSYEFNLVTWMHHGNDFTYIKYLNRAMELGPNRIEHVDFVINQGELDRDLKKRNDALLRKWEAGLISPGMTNYNYNALAGLKEKSILLTAGDNDTYPAWYAQAKGLRTDVIVMNLSLILLDDYRGKLFEELGINQELKVNWEAKDESDPNHYKNFYKRLISTLLSNKKGYTLYVGCTAMGYKDLVNEHKSNLYLTGLAYEYSEESVDERALLKKNFEQVYALDYLLVHYYQDISENLVPVINHNYLVPMLKLYDHYKLSGDKTRMEWLKTYLLAACKGSDSEKEVLKLLQ
ncbi:MAG: hypothetical protein GC180_03330 [Bacteroidetes bacterium]|nr:hypothetical protein [Bacteroidota bacterium]